MSFPAYARSVLGVNLLVILWGAFVRASESGAGAPHVGDIYVSLERARAQAAARRRPWEAEVRLLVVHGVLHSLGHDDEEPAARRLMRRREKVCLAEAIDVPPLFAVD